MRQDASGRAQFDHAMGEFGRGVETAARGIGTFWDRLTDGLAVSQLWEEFRAETQEGYRFFSKDIDWAALQQHSKWKRRLHAAGALSWALLKKLTPARRVFLLLTLLFVINLIRLSGDPAILIPTAALVLLLALELADRVTMKRDLEIARDIQHSLVPDAPPILDGIDIAFATRPANTVSGDYYDAFLRDPPKQDAGRLLLVVADVAGKSIPAALLMATIQASLRTLATSPMTLAEIVSSLNRYACTNSNLGARFTTAFLAELDLPSRRLTYINAGHNAPILRRASGVVERFRANGIPLGVLVATQYTQGETVLAPGDLLVVFTDGVVEAENDREQEFGEPRLLDLVNGIQPVSASHALKSVISSVDAFVGSTRQHDDITSLVLLAR